MEGFDFEKAKGAPEDAGPVAFVEKEKEPGGFEAVTGRLADAIVEAGVVDGAATDDCAGAG